MPIFGDSKHARINAYTATNRSSFIAVEDAVRLNTEIQPSSGNNPYA
jgi:hypothetical protein